MPMSIKRDVASEIVSELPPLNSVGATARALGNVHPITVKRWIRSGRLRAFRMTERGSSRWYVAKDEILRFLASAMGE